MLITGLIASFQVFTPAIVLGSGVGVFLAIA
jgi:hypothetical protein